MLFKCPSVLFHFTSVVFLLLTGGLFDTPEAKNVMVTFKRNIDQVLKEWNCNKPQMRLVYLGNIFYRSLYIIKLIVMLTFSFKQKMNMSIIIRRPFTCLTRLSFIVAINRSVAARRDTFARRPRRRTWPSSSKNFYAAGKWKKKSNCRITFVANVRVSPRSANNYYIFENNNQLVIDCWICVILKFLYII